MTSMKFVQNLIQTATRYNRHHHSRKSSLLLLNSSSSINTIRSQSVYCSASVNTNNHHNGSIDHIRTTKRSITTTTSTTKCLSTRRKLSSVSLDNKNVDDNENKHEIEIENNETNNNVDSNSNSNSIRHENEIENQNDIISDSTLNPVYVHQVSKMVLQHLQDHRSDWLWKHRLDTGLSIHQNGTFILRFPNTDKDNHENGIIWTSYDTKTKKHWLSVYRGDMEGKFLLKNDKDSYIPLSSPFFNHIIESSSSNENIDTSTTTATTTNDTQSVLHRRISTVVDQMIGMVP